MVAPELPFMAAAKNDNMRQRRYYPQREREGEKINAAAPSIDSDSCFTEYSFGDYNNLIGPL